MSMSRQPSKSSHDASDQEKRQEMKASNRPPLPSNAASSSNQNQRPPAAPEIAFAEVKGTPKLATAERAVLRRSNSVRNKDKTNPSPNNFRACPVNRRLLASPTVGVKKQRPQSPTRPMEFAFKTASRALVRTKQEQVADARDNSVKCFKARPMRVGSPDPLPPKQVRPRTVVQPFQLETDRIDAEHKEKLHKMIEEEERKRRKAAAFRAIAMPDFSRPVFCPVLGEKRFTEPEGIQLYTERRAEERKPFDARLKAKEEEMNEVARQREIEKQRAEEEEIRKLRDAAVHRAQPIKRYKPIEIKHDETQITIPSSPKFLIDRRLNERPPSRGHM